MFTKEELLAYTAEMAKNEPTVSSDVDHETEVHIWNLWVAQNRRAFAHAKDADITRVYWRELVEKQIELYEVQQGADLDLKYGWDNNHENREAMIESLKGSVNFLATRVIETSKEY